MAYIRIVYIDELNKLSIQKFSIWDNLGFRKLVCRRQNLKITNLNRPTFSNGKLTKTTIVDLFEFNKLFTNLNHSSQQDLQLLHSSFSHLRKFYQTIVTNSWISYRLSKTMSHVKFELYFIQTFLNEKMAYIRIVDLDELNKLNIQNFSIWDNLGFRKLVCRRRI